jgi:hypothetical protein
VPIKAAKAIIAFDVGEEVKPFKFKAALVKTDKLKALTREQREKTREMQRAKRKAYAAAGKKSVQYGRIAGV